jgi:hypothetical protein
MTLHFMPSLPKMLDLDGTTRYTVLCSLLLYLTGSAESPESEEFITNRSTGLQEVIEFSKDKKKHFKQIGLDVEI